MGMMQTAVHYYGGQPPWLPDGQWCDLDKLAATVVDVGFEAGFAEWRRNALIARPLTLKKRQQAEKRLAWHLANRGVPERFDKTALFLVPGR